MESQIVPYGGWQNNLRLHNAHAELIITLDVGPRIISYRTPDGPNVFKNYEAGMGGSNEPEWQIRGGHRLWVAPEGEASYAPDNHPVPYEVIPGGVRLRPKLAGSPPIGRELTVTLAEDSSRVTLHHRLTNLGNEPVEMASWALSVMAPGGLEIIPQPPLGEHPRDLLPTRVLVPWPYTDLGDPRWNFGTRFITLQQQAGGRPTKLGIAHREGWVSYLNGGTLFTKTFAYEEGAIYPDFGSNFETYTDTDMLEIESLSPLRRLAPGESVSHGETWSLREEVPAPGRDDPDAWIARFISLP